MSVNSDGGGACACGFARPEGRFEIQQHECQLTMTPSVVLPIQPSQLAAIENLRGTSALDFELQAAGFGINQHAEHEVQDAWRVHVPRSDWIKKLRDANARNILLLEVPLPLPGRSTKRTKIADKLQRAEEYFRNGDYHACVASCRPVVVELGQQKSKQKDWATQLLAWLASDHRNGMTKDQRAAALWGTARHYTHQTHHGTMEGGVADYSRDDAQLILILTASFVAHLQAG